MNQPQQIKNMKCSKCECDDECDDEFLFIHSKCHPDAPTWAIINKLNNKIAIVCSECESFIVLFDLQDNKQGFTFQACHFTSLIKLTHMLIILIPGVYIHRKLYASYKGAKNGHWLHQQEGRRDNIQWRP